jgi:hypothetical protein
MKLTAEYDIMASDWANLVQTFIDGGVGREWWGEVELQTRRAAVQPSIHDDRPDRWVTASYSNDHIYRTPDQWRIVLRMDKTCVGDKNTDGKRWGWGGLGTMVQKEYILGPMELMKVADLAPDLFGEWLGSGERNLTTRFDANCADSFMQLAAFGVEVYG